MFNKNYCSFTPFWRKEYGRKIAMIHHVKRKGYLRNLLLVFIGLFVITSLGISNYIYRETFQRKENRWPDLGAADDWQYEILTEAYKIKNKPNRKITIMSSDVIKLVGHYYERKKNAAIVIFFHGFLGDGYTNGVPIYRITEENGWNLLLVSLRAHGESDGDISTLGVLERYDCRDWADWAASEFGEQVPIYLMGISMGGATVLMSSDLELPQSVCGIIDDAGFTSPLEAMAINRREKLHYEFLVDFFEQMVNTGAEIWGGFDLRDANACIAVSKTKVPVLIIHGDRDTRAPLSMAYRIYDSCQSEKEIYIVPGAEHTECYRTDPEKYEKTVSEFIEKYIPQ